MNTSPTITKLAPALVAFCGELEAVAKDARNPHFQSKYATLDALWAYVRPMLAKHGLAAIQGGAATDGSVLTLEMMVLHTSGEWIQSSLTLPVEKRTPQAAGSAVTYARRYLLGAMLSLTTDDDDDGNAASAPKATPKAKADPAPARGPLTRDTPMDFGKKLRGHTVAEQPNKVIEWALSEEGKPNIPDRWQAVFAAERDRRRENGA